MAASETLASATIKRIAREVSDVRNSPPEGILIIPDDDNIANVQAWIQGPDGTPFEGGCFRVRLVFGNDFPNAPPKGFFVTKIFHPNIADSGEICVSTLKKDWKSDLGIKHILLTIKCLLIFPNPESALNEEAGKLLLEDYDAFAKRARMITGIYAQNKSVQFAVPAAGKPVDVATSAAVSASAKDNSNNDHVVAVKNGGVTVSAAVAAPAAEKTPTHDALPRKRAADDDSTSSTHSDTVAKRAAVLAEKRAAALADKRRTLRRL